MPRGRGRGARGATTERRDTARPRAANRGNGRAFQRARRSRNRAETRRLFDFCQSYPKTHGRGARPRTGRTTGDKRGGSFGGIVRFELEDVRSRQNEKYDDNNVCGGMIIIPSYATCICVSTPPESSDGNTDCPPGCDEE